MTIADRDAVSATENTPLLATPDVEADNKPEGRMSIGRTLLITVLMGILIFIQCKAIN